MISNILLYANEYSSIVIAAAAVITAIFTAILACSHLIERGREKKKPRIQKIAEVVIYPMVEILERQKKDLEKGTIVWEKSGYPTHVNTMSSFLWDTHIYDDFKKDNQKVADKIEKHDGEVYKLRACLQEFADNIKSLPDFKNTISTRFEEYKSKEKGDNASFFEPTTNNFGNILESIVNNEQELNERMVYHKFWSLYGKELLKFREREEVQEYKIEVGKRCRILINIESAILNDLRNILKEFREKYGIVYSGFEDEEKRRLLK